MRLGGSAVQSAKKGPTATVRLLQVRRSVTLSL